MSQDKDAGKDGTPDQHDGSVRSGLLDFFVRQHPGCSIAVLFVLSIVLLAVGWLRWNERKLQKMLADIAARGEPSTMEDLIGDAVEPELDAAPLYAKAASLFRQAESGVPQEGRAVDAKGDPWQPAFGNELTGKQVAEFRQFMERKDIGEALDLVKQAATRPHCRIPTGVGANAMLLQSGLADTRHCSRLVAARMRIHVMSGEPDAALELAPAGLHITASVDENAAYIAGLMAVACYANIHYGLKSVLQKTTPSPVRLREIETLLSNGPVSKTYADRLREDRIESVNSIWAMFQSSRTGALNALSRPIAVANAISYLELANRAIAAAELPPVEAREALRSIENELRQQRRRLTNIPANFASVMMAAPTMSTRGYDVFARHYAMRDSMRIAIAIRLFKMEKGRRPDSLSELTAEFLTQPLPKDPFTGKDYLVLYEDGLIIVYSVGENGKDDGGWIEDREVTENGKTKTERRRDIGTRIKE